MTTTSISAMACAPGALPGGPVRTRFFDGMFLTQADLENEQRFWRLKRRLTNRALGEGVVWGLRLAWNEQRRTFALSPGYALDCCGNDLVVECPVEVSETELWSRSDPALRPRPGYIADPVFGSGNAPIFGNANGEALTRSACVVLQYTECAEDARPVHRDACGGASNHCEPSRVRETARLLFVPPPVVQPTPPEKFLEELSTFRDSLPANIRDALFPPQGGTTTTPASGDLPLHLLVTVPGSSSSAAATADIDPKATGTITEDPFSTVQTVGPGTRTAVVTFQLLPKYGWGFTAGSVTDHGRVVETVTAPPAQSMYWAFDLAVPTENETAAEFEFVVDKVDVAQMFGGARHGRVSLRIKGALIAKTIDNATATVSVEKLTVTTELAEVADTGNADQGCLRDLVPWGWAIDPANGPKLASTLVLSSLYAFLSEVVRRGSAWSKVATLLYGATWYALFGVNPFAPVDEPYRKKLAELILDLYRRWCEGMAYPGPRCTDEHHGVYLGCAEIDRSGRIRSFDMWEHRRYVVTGALLGAWARQLGIAPLDVIAGRFASAVCCLSGLPALAMPIMNGRLSPGIGGEAAHDRFHIGTAGTVVDFARLHGVDNVRWVTVAELGARTGEAFLRRDGGEPFEVLATQIEDGGSIAIAVPGPSSREYEKIRDATTDLLRRGETRVRERGRPVVADFTVELLKRTPATSLELSEPATLLAKKLAERGATLADVLDLGAEGIVARVAGDRAKDLPAADELVDTAEMTLDSVVAATVKALGPTVDRATFLATDAMPRLEKTLKGAKLRFETGILATAVKRIGAG